MTASILIIITKLSDRMWRSESPHYQDEFCYGKTSREARRNFVKAVGGKGGFLDIECSAYWDIVEV